MIYAHRLQKRRTGTSKLLATLKPVGDSQQLCCKVFSRSVLQADWWFRSLTSLWMLRMDAAPST